MDSQYEGFVGRVWEEFPQLAEWHNLDPAKLPMWKFEKFIEVGYHNFLAERKPLYNLSKMIEKYAQDNGEPLLATFEKISRFAFVKKRYQEMMKNIPKIWIVADLDKSIDATKQMPSNGEFFNCHNTELVNVWTVITRGPYGPFGLIAEEYDDGKFRGFFTLNPNVCRYALKLMGSDLGTKFTIQ